MTGLKHLPISETIYLILSRVPGKEQFYILTTVPWQRNAILVNKRYQGMEFCCLCKKWSSYKWCGPLKVGDILYLDGCFNNLKVKEMIKYKYLNFLYFLKLS
ncbi:hypothetical protein GPDM_03080 [Planococcus donghaensis MPA1U2]|uniref:Uncharacterized protein n=1 Tax=Planococcus donghaensis MPA1U2 TaxID=933115 RepID=E7RDT8_9BACL|nr:hypothetical protein GPDM_03080 [Planococcus donghaensis MPA1U2]